MAIDPELKSLRADELSILIGMLDLFGPEWTATSSALYSSLGKQWKRSRCYHYISALTKTGLATKSESTFRLKPIARELLSVSESSLLQPSTM